MHVQRLGKSRSKNIVDRVERVRVQHDFVGDTYVRHQRHMENLSVRPEILRVVGAFHDQRRHDDRGMRRVVVHIETVQQTDQIYTGGRCA